MIHVVDVLIEKRIPMPHKHQSTPWLPISIVGQLVALLLIVLAVLGMSAPASPIRLAVDSLPTARPTPTNTPVPDWWTDLHTEQPACHTCPHYPPSRSTKPN